VKILSEPFVHSLYNKPLTLRRAVDRVALHPVILVVERPFEVEVISSSAELSGAVVPIPTSPYW